MLDYRIRSMEIEDVPVVYRMGVKEFDMTKMYHQYWGIIKLAVYLDKDKDLCVVAESDGEIVGFALGRQRYSKWSDNLGCLEWIAVAKKYQNQGVGSALVDEMITRFKKLGITRILADVEAERSSSRKLLDRSSFERVFSVDWYIKKL